MQSTHSAAAKQIKAELKAAFPSVKFSVKSDIFSGGDAVRIRYEDGPTTKQVDEIVGKFQEGSFNSYEDLYEYDNRNEDLPQVKYVQVARDKSEAKKAEVMEMIGITVETENEWLADFRCYGSELVWRKFSTIDFTA